MTMFAISLRRENHVRHYSIEPGSDAGWNAQLQEDAALTRCVHYRDWHRVERRIALMHQEIDDLLRDGWQIDAPAKAR